MVRWRRWRRDACPVQFSSPVPFEVHWTSTSGCGPGASASPKSKPWRPASPNYSGAWQESGPLVGPRGDAVRYLLGQQRRTSYRDNYYRWKTFRLLYAYVTLHIRIRIQISIIFFFVLVSLESRVQSPKSLTSSSSEVGVTGFFFCWKTQTSQ